MAGVRYDTVRRWRNQGRKDRQAGHETEHCRFFVAFEKARALLVDDQLSIIHKSAKGNKQTKGQWQAAAWLLERRRPETFALNRDQIREMLKRQAEIDAQLKQLLANQEKKPDVPAPSGAAQG